MFLVGWWVVVIKLFSPKRQPTWQHSLVFVIERKFVVSNVKAPAALLPRLPIFPLVLSPPIIYPNGRALLLHNSPLQFLDNTRGKMKTELARNGDQVVV